MPQMRWRHSPKSRKRSRWLIAACLCIGLIICNDAADAAGNAKQPDRYDEILQLRSLYAQIAEKTGLRWQQLAAIDQYERTLTRVHRKSRPVPKEARVGIYIPESVWAGAMNPDPADTSPLSIRMFGGIGRDGDGDGRAERTSAHDVLFTVASAIGGPLGNDQEHFRIRLWHYYGHERAVQRIVQFTAILDACGDKLTKRHAFPLPVRADYSYRNTWGDRRGWGGRRIHEGTDIFAGYGVPVRSTSLGIVEMKGWNRYGGWRVGIRDLDNIYHYYAHLQGFAQNIKPGVIVQPGQVIGWVGSSGYGRPGTQGKFPPHLHYGVYRDRGMVEWAFNPYPLLRQWERDERRAQRAAR